MAFLIASSELGSAMELLSQYGPFVGLLVIAAAFNMWRDWKRENRQTKRIDDLQIEVRDTLIPLIRESNGVISKNSSVMERHSAVMERLEKHLDR